MERKVKVLYFEHIDQKPYVILRDGTRKWLYRTPNDNFVLGEFDVHKLLNDDNYYNQVIESGYEYNWFDDVKIVNKDILRDCISQDRKRKEEKQSEGLTRSGIIERTYEYYEERKKIMTLRKIVKREDIQDYYEISSFLEIKGLRTDTSNFLTSTEWYPEYIYFTAGYFENYQAAIDKFGEPKDNHPIDGGRVKCYKMSTQSINKFFFVKKTCDLESITREEPTYTGQEEIKELDLDNFDESIYKEFEEYRIVKVEKK